MIKYVLKVDGMKCGMCESHINDIVRKYADIKKVKSSHISGTTTIIAKHEIDIDGIIIAIKESGYLVFDITKEHFEKKCLFR